MKFFKFIIGVIVIISVVNCSGGNSAKVEEDLNKLTSPKAEFNLASPVYEDKGTLPEVYTCNGDYKSPPLKWFNIPKGTKSFVLIYKDLDAPSGIWTHWILYDIPATVDKISENSTPSGVKVGKNEMGTNEFTAPCPPSGVHRYIFDLYALDIETLNPKEDTRVGIEKAISGHVLEKTTLESSYSK